MDSSPGRSLSDRGGLRNPPVAEQETSSYYQSVRPNEGSGGAGSVGARSGGVSGHRLLSPSRGYGGGSSRPITPHNSSSGGGGDHQERRDLQTESGKRKIASSDLSGGGRSVMSAYRSGGAGDAGRQTTDSARALMRTPKSGMVRRAPTCRLLRLCFEIMSNVRAFCCQTEFGTSYDS
jgi:hypothetical protein